MLYGVDSKNLRLNKRREAMYWHRRHHRIFFILAVPTAISLILFWVLLFADHLFPILIWWVLLILSIVCCASFALHAAYLHIMERRYYDPLFEGQKNPPKEREELMCELHALYRNNRDWLEPELTEEQLHQFLESVLRMDNYIEHDWLQPAIINRLELIAWRQRVRAGYNDAEHIIGHVVSRDFVEKYLELLLPLEPFDFGKCVPEMDRRAHDLESVLRCLKRHWGPRRHLLSDQAGGKQGEKPVIDPEILRQIEELRERCRRDVEKARAEMQEQGDDPTLIEPEVAHIEGRYAEEIAKLEARMNQPEEPA